MGKKWRCGVHICARRFAYAQPGTKYRQRRVQGLQGLEVKDKGQKAKNTRCGGEAKGKPGSPLESMPGASKLFP